MTAERNLRDEAIAPVAHEVRLADGGARHGVDRDEGFVVVVVDGREERKLVLREDGLRAEEALVARALAHPVEHLLDNGDLAARERADDRAPAVGKRDGPPLRGGGPVVLCAWNRHITNLDSGPVPTQ